MGRIPGRYVGPVHYPTLALDIAKSISPGFAPMRIPMNHKLLASLAISTAILASGNVAAQTNLQISMSMRKEIQLRDNSTVYRMGFNLNGDPLKKARKVTIAIPNGKKMEMQNPLRLNAINLGVAESDYPYLVKTFPEGQYTLRVMPKPPKDKGSRTVFLSHDFPAALALITPSPTATTLPLGFTASWYPLANPVTGLFVDITGPSLDYATSLPTTATSFTVPEGLLSPGKTYRMALGVRIQADATGSHETVQVVNFTTAAQ